MIIHEVSNKRVRLSVLFMFYILYDFTEACNEMLCVRKRMQSIYHHFCWIYDGKFIVRA